MCARLQTVVETSAYLSAAKGLLSDSERGEVVNMVAENPEMGVSLGGGIGKNEDRPPRTRQKQWGTRGVPVLR